MAWGCGPKQPLDCSSTHITQKRPDKLRNLGIDYADPQNQSEWKGIWGKDVTGKSNYRKRKIDDKLDTCMMMMLVVIMMTMVVVVV